MIMLALTDIRDRKLYEEFKKQVDIAQKRMEEEREKLIKDNDINTAEGEHYVNRVLSQKAREIEQEIKNHSEEFNDKKRDLIVNCDRIECIKNAVTKLKDTDEKPVNCTEILLYSGHKILVVEEVKEINAILMQIMQMNKSQSFKQELTRQLPGSVNGM